MRTARGNELESIHGEGKKSTLGGGEVRDCMEKKRDSSCMGYRHTGLTAPSSALQAKTGMG